MIYHVFVCIELCYTQVECITRVSCDSLILVIHTFTGASHASHMDITRVSTNVLMQVPTDLRLPPRQEYQNGCRPYSSGETCHSIGPV